MIFFVHVRGYFQANPPFDQSSFVAAFVVEFPMPGWVCQWKPFWIPVGESFKKAFLEEWIFTGDDSSDEQGVTNFPVLLHSTGNTDYIRDDDPPTPRPSRQPDSLPWEPSPRIRPTFGNELRHHCLLYGPDATSSLQGSSVPLLNAWSCPFEMM